MGEMAEDRIYADRRGKTDVYVGAGLGLTLVKISDDRVGRFRLLRRGGITSIAAADGEVLFGTVEDVYRGTESADFESLSFGPATAVSWADAPIAVTPDGDLARQAGQSWHSLGTVEDVRAIDRDWMATVDGVVRISADGLERVESSPEDVRDVTRIGSLAATGDGLYRYRDGEWTRERDGTWSVVASDGDRAHAVGEEGFFERIDGEWRKQSLPVEEQLMDVGYGQSLVAITDRGTVLVDPAAAKDGASGWRTRSLGLTDVTGLTIQDS